ncbi:hypothetical protein KKE34_01330 [Patescibacteria group bacterium]|nr:hypothetical protein [Patescibacteria group bacterium]MBU1885231.1 hypothetical protein [Patescibacteria group bacterium]
MKNFLVGLSLLAIIIASSWALAHDQFFRVHDYVHAARVIEMHRALGDGQFPVRWSENFGYGYGMPLFEFYAPLPYYLGAVLHWFGFSVLTAVKLLFLFSAIFTTWGSYKLGSKLFGRTAGVLTAAAITLAPYRAVNLFVRGALSEAWGIMAMPWVLLGILQVIRQKKNGWKTLTLSLVMLMLSHNIMTMLFVPLSLLFTVLYLGYYKWVIHKNKNSELKTLLKVSGSLLLAAGLSSFYLFPALLEKNLTKVGSIFSGYFHYSHHFLYIRQFFQLNWGFEGSAWGPDDGISFFLGWGQWLGLGVLGLLFLVRVFKYKKWQKIITDKKLVLAVLLALLFGLSLFMAILKSKSLWDALPGLSFAQFPWRFLGVGIIFLGLLVGMSASLIKQRWQRYLWTVVLLVILLFNAKLFAPKEFLTNAQDFYYTQEDLIEREMSGILPDYIPAQMAEKLIPPKKLAWCEAGCQEQIEVLIDRSHENLIKTKFNQEQIVEFAVADFPGWKVELDGQRFEKQQGELGNIVVKVPGGEHLVGLLLTQTPTRLFFDVVSIISLLIFAYLTIEIREKSNLH